ncbi:hypothetical protein ACIQAC_09945 [Streptomyces sp. NPDC088387]|uniref:hypothetical protein n=1 Tax=Streptomyces sp. NPDC088387 TaxID=3365859 RepID=UPI003826E7D1
MLGRTSARNGRPPARYTRALVAAVIAAVALITAANAGPARAATADGVTHSARP